MILTGGGAILGSHFTPHRVEGHIVETSTLIRAVGGVRSRDARLTRGLGSAHTETRSCFGRSVPIRASFARGCEVHLRRRERRCTGGHNGANLGRDGARRGTRANRTSTRGTRGGGLARAGSGQGRPLYPHYGTGLIHEGSGCNTF